MPFIYLTFYPLHEAETYKYIASLFEGTLREKKEIKMQAIIF